MFTDHGRRNRLGPAPAGHGDIRFKSEALTVFKYRDLAAATAAAGGRRFQVCSPSPLQVTVKQASPVPVTVTWPA
jgi:hypothetical protein